MDCFLEATRLREPVRLLQDLSSGGGRAMDTPLAKEADGQIKTGKKRLEDLANVGVAMHLRIGSLFRESVSTPWLKMNKFFRDYSLDPITKDFSLINDAMKEAATACEAACIEVGLPFKPTEYVAGLAAKQTGREPTK